MSSDSYELWELIEILKEIKEIGDGDLNFPKALLCLAEYIESLQKHIQYLHDLVPTKYKRAFPKDHESPYFGICPISPLRPQDLEECKRAKERMLNLIKPNS